MSASVSLEVEHNAPIVRRLFDNIDPLSFLQLKVARILDMHRLGQHHICVKTTSTHLTTIIIQRFSPFTRFLRLRLCSRRRGRRGSLDRLGCDARDSSYRRRRKAFLRCRKSRRHRGSNRGRSSRFVSCAMSDRRIHALCRRQVDIAKFLAGQSQLSLVSCARELESLPFGERASRWLSVPGKEAGRARSPVLQYVHARLCEAVDAEEPQGPKCLT